MVLRSTPLLSRTLRIRHWKEQHTLNLEIIDLLLTWGASDIFYASGCALEQGHWPAAQALLSGVGLGDSDNEAYQSMLLRAGVQSDDYHLVQGLLRTMVDADAPHAPKVQDDAKSTTALQGAEIQGRIDLVELLMVFGANFNAPAAGKY